MPRYYVTFEAKRRGAVGQPWPYARIVTAPTAVAAVAALYASHEAITSAEVAEVDPMAPDLPHDRARLRPGVRVGCGQPCAECYVIPTATATRIGSAVWHARARPEVRA
jgi:hypothetical protein